MLTFARVRALAIVSVLVAGALVAVIMAVTRDSGGLTLAGDQGCPEGSIVVQLAPLPEVSDVKLNVYNGTDQAGLASQVGENFANRGFQVVDTGDSENRVEEIAVLRYGPAAVAAAQVVDAYFLNDATEDFLIDRKDDVVDVLIGQDFRQLATETEVRQAIAAVGNPAPPPGTCAE
jgi:hypothetical protein